LTEADDRSPGPETVSVDRFAAVGVDAEPAPDPEPGHGKEDCPLSGFD